MEEPRLPSNVRRVIDFDESILKKLDYSKLKKIWVTPNFSEDDKFQRERRWLDRFLALKDIAFDYYPSMKFTSKAFCHSTFFDQVRRLETYLIEEKQEREFCLAFDDESPELLYAIEMNRRTMTPTLLLTKKTMAEIRDMNPLVFFDPFIEIYNTTIVEALTDYIERCLGGL